MINLKLFTSFMKPDSHERGKLVDFLFEHLGQYGDPKGDIDKAIAYALKERPSLGGFILISKEDEQITGTVVVNQTGMEGYIPENILVYIATHKEYRGKGIGKKLMEKALEIAKGDVALHVEPDNPARFLYEKVGFSSKYVEMRFQPNKK
ncbi:MAG: GNAT family N-acetyltransferase [Marinifilaceae bacterium]